MSGEIKGVVVYEWGGTDASYSDLIDSMDLDVVSSVDIGSYQGDSFAVVRRGDEYGWLEYGWGSCSGCDALQACETMESVVDLRDDIYRGIQWKDSKDEFVQWMRDRDWKGQWSHSDELMEFVNKNIEEMSK